MDDSRIIKLIREKIPQRVGHVVVSYEPLVSRQRDRFLKRKLFEEALEYMETEEIAELGDVLEVVRALARRHGLTLEELISIADAKAEIVGGFNGGMAIVLHRREQR